MPQVDIQPVNILLPENKTFFDMYQNDIPVIHLNDKEIARHRTNEFLILQHLSKLMDEEYKSGKWY